MFKSGLVPSAIFGGHGLHLIVHMLTYTTDCTVPSCDEHYQYICEQHCEYLSFVIDSPYATICLIETVEFPQLV